MGPGFPLGFAFGPASACAAVRFVPGLGPGTPFLLPLVAGGGARELLSVAVASVPGTGVPFVSEASGAGALMRGVEAGAGEAVGDGSETSSDSGLNFFNRWGAIRRTTSLFGLTDDLAEAFCEGVVAIVDGMGGGWVGKAGGDDLDCARRRRCGFVSMDLWCGLFAGFTECGQVLDIESGISRNRTVVMVVQRRLMDEGGRERWCQAL